MKMEGKSEIARIAEICARLPLALEANQRDRAIQCDRLDETALGGGGLRRAKRARTLPTGDDLRSRITRHLLRFSTRTSSHGVPALGRTTSGVKR